MPWTSRDAYRHTKKASTPAAQQRWAATANSVLEQSGDEAKAIRIANSTVEHTKGTKAPKRKRA